jgi:hypothetical protein
LLAFLTSFEGKSQDSTLRFEVQDTFVKVKHSPTRAALLSAIVPGMGQIYNKKYWKVPLIYGGLGALGYYIVHFNNLHRQYLNAYIQYKKFGNSEPLYHLPKFAPEYQIEAQLKYYKDTYGRWRDMDVMFFGAVYILNIIDATVDAYLFNYDISEDLSLRIEPALINTYASKGAPGLKLCLKIW